MEFSDDIENLGYIIKSEEVICAEQYDTYRSYESLVNMLSIGCFIVSIGLVCITLVNYLYKKRKHKKAKEN